MNSVLMLEQGKRLEYLTLIWNVIGCFVLLYAAPKTHSVALIAFGLDSLLEIGASVIVLWALNGADGSRQKSGLRLLSVAFFCLGIYVLLQGAYYLNHHIHPSESLWGAIWLSLTLVVMLILSWRKLTVGRLLNNPVLITESRVTLADAALAFIVLLSMVFIKYFDLWGADVAGGIILVLYCFRESFHAWKESAAIVAHNPSSSDLR